jgi:hypothetical protein
MVARAVEGRRRTQVIMHMAYRDWCRSEENLLTIQYYVMYEIRVKE